MTLDSSNTRSAEERHIPVLKEAVLSFFNPRSGQTYLDGTLGMGGHAEGLLTKAKDNGQSVTLIGLDRDRQALELASQRLAAFAPALVTAHSTFAHFEDVLADKGIEHIDGALIDIGVSSLQIDEAERGFSFAHDGPLDMRMDQTSGQSAATLVNKLSVVQLKELISTLGEEPMAGKIARAIDDARAARSIETTMELAAIVEQAYPAKWRAKARNHPATRTFQALRMAVNGELDELRGFLERIIPRLSPGARVGVITFHSLEDRIVKHFFRDQAMGCRCPRHIPVCICHNTPKISVLTKKPIIATDDEIRQNPRASSAKLRVAEKLP